MRERAQKTVRKYCEISVFTNELIVKVGTAQDSFVIVALDLVVSVCTFGETRVSFLVFFFSDEQIGKMDKISLSSLESSMSR